MDDLSADWIADAVALRQDLHRHPELLFDLARTAGIVAQTLRGWGCDEVVEGIGRSGVVAVIRGKNAGPTIGLRADMDALPMTEATQLPYASQSAGKMHAIAQGFGLEAEALYLRAYPVAWNDQKTTEFYTRKVSRLTAPLHIHPKADAGVGALM